MILSYNQLVKLVEDKVITNVYSELINGTSIDVTLGPEILVEENPQHQLVSLRKREPLPTKAIILSEDGYILQPKEFILAHSVQKFFLPRNISAQYALKSSMARIGLEHLNAGWCDATWTNSVLTMELFNMTRHTPIVIHPGDRIGQVKFFVHEPVPEKQSYALCGRYNNDTSVTGIKE